MIYVTHDQVEAMTLADRIVVLRAGRVEQVGTPLDLYNAPINRFIAGFIGAPHMNFLDATVESSAPGRTVALLRGGHRLAVSTGGPSLGEGRCVTLGLRPQTVALGSGPHSLPARLRLVEALGSETVLHAEVGGQKLLAVAQGQHRLTPGETVDLSLASAPVHIFDEAGHRLATAPLADLPERAAAG
jgi:multiple sugar transport system ATP-binding protein